MAHVFTVKSNANRKIRATHRNPEDFTVEPVEGGFIVRMTVRNEAEQELARMWGFEFAVPGIEPADLSPADEEAVEKAISKGTFAGLKRPTKEEWEASQQEAEAPEADAQAEEIDLPETFRLERAKPAAEVPDVVGYLSQGLVEKPAAESKARKPRTPKAAPAPKAPKAAKPAKAEKAGPGKFAAIREAAERGELPPVPDFSADLHKRNRGRLAQLVAMAEAGDVAGLEAFPIKPNCTSPKAMDRYRNLCVAALKARAAKSTA